MARVVLDNVVKRFGNVEAVRNVSLEIADGEFLVLIGPSGCGKSTTLRMVAGLEPVTSGKVKFNNKVVNNLTPKDRDIAMVFQSYALYPHMTVFDNMAFGLKLRRMSREEIRERVVQAAGMLNIKELLLRKPRELSGGQRQRVAMGRAIVRQPQAFLFDEPLSNLDASLRAQMRVEIKRLHQKLATTIIYVTHDQVEAMTLADRIVLMKDGEIVQVGAPMEVYERPVNKFAAGFIGAPKMNFIPGRLIEHPGYGMAVATSDGVALPVPRGRHGSYGAYVGSPVELGVRPEHIQGGTTGQPDGATFEAVVDVVEPMGAEALVVLTLAGAEVAAKCEPHDAPRPGERATFTANMAKMHLIDPGDGRVVPADEADVIVAAPRRFTAQAATP
jgi:multiple sugar transport system ATP-binding protein